MAASGSDPYLEKARAIVLEALGEQSARVFLFGSRAWGRPARGSDVDVGILAESPLAEGTLTRMREALEESDVPYVVEVVDLAEVDDSFRRKVVADGVPWIA